MNIVWRSGTALIAGVALTIAACGDDGTDGVGLAEATTMPVGAPLTVDGTIGAAVVPTGVVVPIIALDNSFRPELTRVDVGDEVRWENRGLNDHDVLYVDGGDWGIDIEGFGPGEVFSHVFDAPGEYRYYCSIHGNESAGMVGTIIVEE